MYDLYNYNKRNRQNWTAGKKIFCPLPVEKVVKKKERS